VLTPRTLPRWTRAVIVAVIVLMGVALIAMVWMTQRTARAAREMVIRGQIAQANAAVRARILEMPETATVAERTAESLVVATAEGVRYLAWLDADGAIVADAGRPTADQSALTDWIVTAAPGQPVRIGNRVRVVFRRIRTTPPKPNDPPPPPRRTPPGLLLELDPSLADELGTTATWTMVVGTAAAATLLVLIAILVRWSLRREDHVRTMEQARHLASLGQMSAVLAHEIRNPLASLKGNAQLLAQMLPDGERPRAKADRVVDEAVRLEHLTNDLLDFAKSGEIRIAVADPAALLREAAAAVDGARVQIGDAGAPRSFPLDADRMRQVLVNLLDNAVSISDGPVAATVARVPGGLCFTVRDHGPGLGDADPERVFEPFYTRRQRGTGLGLAVCKRLVELHGGTIAAGDAAGGGAEFRITLPKPS